MGKVSDPFNNELPPELDLRIQQEPKKSAIKDSNTNIFIKYLPVSISIFVVMAFLGGVWASYNYGLQKGLKSTLPLIKASSDPIKIEPLDPGGLVIRNQERQIFDVMNNANPEPQAEQLLQPPEEPLVSLRPEERSEEQLDPEIQAQSEENTIESEESPEDKSKIEVPKIQNPLNSQITPDSELKVLADPVILTPQVTLIRIQLGAYQHREDALASWTILKRRHTALLADLQPEVRQVDIDETRMYRLQAGPFSNVDDANLLCRRMLARESECLVIGH